MRKDKAPTRRTAKQRMRKPTEAPVSADAPPSFAQVLREVLAMDDGHVMDDSHVERDPRSRFLSLSSARSQFQKLCDEEGGPADIGVTLDKSYLERCCNEYPQSRICPLLLRFQKDKTLVRSHWPLAAFAISQYDYETKERTKYTDEPAPKEIGDLLSQIEQSARDLNSGLCRLQALSNRLSDPTAPLRRAHLEWLDAFVSQAAAGFFSNDVNENGQHLLIVQWAKVDLLERLADVEKAAKVVAQRLDRTLLERERGQSNPALLNFVFRCSEIWRSLTSRKPSANKVAGRDGRTDPDFVIFVQGLARVGGAPEATRDQVDRCLQNIPPAIKSKNSLKSQG